MRRIYAILIISMISHYFGANSSVFAFHGAIEGKVGDSKNNPLVAVQVYLEGYKLGDATDANGWYEIEVPEIKVPMAGQFKVIYQYIGFASETLTVTVPYGERVRKDVTLRESVLQFKEIKVKGRRETIYRAETPEPTTVIPHEAIERAGTTTLGEAIELESGIRQQTKCALCGPTELSIQGLPGRFSLMLLEGMPLFSGIASLYMLDMFPASFLDRVEVLKGASGAIWGSDAIAGAVNVLLPHDHEKLIAKSSYTYRDYGSDLSGSFGTSFKKSVDITAMAASGKRYQVDVNGDTIAENIGYLRDIYVTSIKVSPSSAWNFIFGGFLGDETRKAGAIVPEQEYGVNTEAFKVSTQIYDLWHQSRFTSGDNSLGLKLASSNHEEEGFLGGRKFTDEQKTSYGELSTTLKKFVMGASASRQLLSDARLYESYNEEDYGIWSSFERQILGPTLLSAVRVDLNSKYGTIFSPYGAIRFLLGGTDFNFAIGTGFRTPSLTFKGLHGTPVGFRYVIQRDTSLSEETSISIQGGIGKELLSNIVKTNIQLNFFQNRVTNFIGARLQRKDTVTKQIIYYYYNVDGVTTSTGAELTTSLMLLGNIDLALSAFALIPKSADGQHLPFINRWGINYSST